jgi:hypothetical protein
MLCRFVKNPGREHWEAAKLLLRYLKCTKALGTIYSKNTTCSDLEFYAHSDFANDLDKRRSLSTYVIMLANGPIAWKFILQTSILLLVFMLNMSHFMMRSEKSFG